MNYTIPELWERCKKQSNFTERAQEVAAFNRFLIIYMIATLHLIGQDVYTVLIGVTVLCPCLVLLDFWLTVKAAPHECVIRTSQP